MISDGKHMAGARLEEKIAKVEKEPPRRCFTAGQLDGERSGPLAHL